MIQKLLEAKGIDFAPHEDATTKHLYKGAVQVAYDQGADLDVTIDRIYELFGVEFELDNPTFLFWLSDKEILAVSPGDLEGEADAYGYTLSDGEGAKHLTLEGWAAYAATLVDGATAESRMIVGAGLTILSTGEGIHASLPPSDNEAAVFATIAKLYP